MTSGFGICVHLATATAVIGGTAGRLQHRDAAVWCPGCGAVYGAAGFGAVRPIHTAGNRVRGMPTPRFRGHRFDRRRGHVTEPRPANQLVRGSFLRISARIARTLPPTTSRNSPRARLRLRNLPSKQRSTTP